MRSSTQARWPSTGASFSSTRLPRPASPAILSANAAIGGPMVSNTATAASTMAEMRAPSSGARLVVALGPNGELDLWPTVQKVLALKPLPVLQILAGVGDLVVAETGHGHVRQEFALG